MHNSHSNHPEREDIPLGLGMRLAQDPQASKRFWRLTPGERAQTVAYVQGGATGEEAQERIAETVEKLRAESRRTR
ncbi:MAG: YdeI/OmpD-associated family protein [Oscillospiraceae bacterium]|nr:YdeI/OmpD-associated family protein [Oscillospiraceae bacterium]